MKIQRNYVNGLLGLNLSSTEIADYLARMRYGVKASGDTLSVSIPAYRTDVLHPMDLVEDVAIAYGYHNFIPEELTYHTRVREDTLERNASALQDAMIGLGFTEVMTLIMTNKKTLFRDMEAPEKEVVETENPSSEEHSVCRNWLLPSLMTVLAKNKTREFPQKVFELGDVVLSSGANKKNLAAVVSHARTNYSEIKSTVEGILSSLGVNCEVKALPHPSFIPGRCAETCGGFFGEIHPQVLENFGLEMPVTAFELSVEDLLSRA
jgi:phenylalanyl-tRNA synthetase beta chain